MWPRMHRSSVGGGAARAAGAAPGVALRSVHGPGDGKGIFAAHGGKSDSETVYLFLDRRASSAHKCVAISTPCVFIHLLSDSVLSAV